MKRQAWAQRQCELTLQQNERRKLQEQFNSEVRKAVAGGMTKQQALLHFQIQPSVFTKIMNGR